MAEVRMDNRTKFMLWLLDKVTSAQLSELYFALHEIELQAKKDKLIRTSLYENLDSSFIDRICEDIKSNKMFRFTHKRQWGQIIIAMDLLKKYAKRAAIYNDSSKQDPELLIKKSIENNSIETAAKETLPVKTDVGDEYPNTSKELIDVSFTKGSILEVDFFNLESVAFTNPCSLSYFGDVKRESSWEDLYVDACEYLFEDYPHVFTRLRMDSISGTGMIWLVDSEHLSSLAAPRRVADEFYVETKLSASDLMKSLKWLLDMCFVDYENVIITYIKRSDIPVEKTENAEPIYITDKKTTQHYQADKEAFFRWMLENQHKAESTCRGYISAIRTAERFAEDHGLTSVKLFTDNPDEAKATAEALFALPEFVQYNAVRHNPFSAAITMLLSFYEAGQKAADEACVNCAKGDVQIIESQRLAQPSIDYSLDIFLAGDEYAPLRNALALQHITTVKELKNLKLWPFMNRYNLYSIGTRQMIYTRVNAMLFPEDNLNDDQAFILYVGEDSYKGKTPAETFKKFCDKMLIQYPLQLRLLVGIKNPAGSVPICKHEDSQSSLKLTNLSAFVREDLSVDDVISNANWVQNRCGEGTTSISMSMPKRLETFADQASANKDSSIKTAVTAPLKSAQAAQRRISAYIKQIEQIVLAADTEGVSYNDAKEAINATMAATKNAVADSEHIIDIKGRLIHEEAFIDWEDGAEQLETIIDKLMYKNNGYISASQLYEYAKVEMNMFLTDNDINDERSVFDIATHLFEKRGYHNKHYIFSGKIHISRPGHPVTSNLDIFRNYAADQGGIFSFDSLVEYLHRIGVATGNLRVQMRISEEPIFFFYESGILMCADSMHIDESWKGTVKKELSSLLNDVGNHIVLRTIPDNWFERLPALPGGKIWTPLLLQSVLRCYSKEFGAKTIQALSGQTLDTTHAMLVANDSPIQTFGDVVISYLLDNGIKERSFEAEGLRLLLVDAGILHGSELIWNMPKALNNDERFAWNASGDHVIVEV